jgi:hypothetical protein
MLMLRQAAPGFQAARGIEALFQLQCADVRREGSQSQIVIMHQWFPLSRYRYGSDLSGGIIESIVISQLSNQ